MFLVYSQVNPIFGFDQWLNSKRPVGHMPLNAKTWEKVAQDNEKYKKFCITLGQWYGLRWDLSVLHLKKRGNHLSLHDLVKT